MAPPNRVGAAFVGRERAGLACAPALGWAGVAGVGRGGGQAAAAAGGALRLSSCSSRSRHAAVTSVVLAEPPMSWGSTTPSAAGPHARNSASTASCAGSDVHGCTPGVLEKPGGRLQPAGWKKVLTGENSCWLDPTLGEGRGGGV